MGLLGLTPVQAVTTHTLQVEDGMGRKGVRPLSLYPEVSNWWKAERGDFFRQHNYIPCKGTPGIAHFLTGNVRGSTWNRHRSHTSCSHILPVVRPGTGSWFLAMLLQLLTLCPCTFLLSQHYKPRMQFRKSERRKKTSLHHLRETSSLSLSSLISTF